MLKIRKKIAARLREIKKQKHLVMSFDMDETTEKKLETNSRMENIK